MRRYPSPVNTERGREKDLGAFFRDPQQTAVLQKVRGMVGVRLSEIGSAGKEGEGQGRSGAPAEDLARKVTTALEIFADYFAALESEEKRCQHNLEEIAGGAESIEMEQTKSWFSKAQTAQNAQLETVLKQEEAALKIVLKVVEFLLKAAAGQRSNDAAPGGEKHARSASSDLEALFALGEMK